ncbi:hypothetical protein SDC9_69988 [bioreactor metagenome]|uniref:Uncharacterized protein n=1 Tax=bioreactor metagenome TaxID=1076179 RepID=A0A644YBL2_9ZZZZ
MQTRGEVEALSIGPDLNRGTVLVLRRSRAGTPAQAAAPTTGADELATEPQADDEPFATPAGTAVEEVAGPLLGGAAVDHHSLSDDDRPLEDAANDDGRAYGQAVA